MCLDFCTLIGQTGSRYRPADIPTTIKERFIERPVGEDQVSLAALDDAALVRRMAAQDPDALQALYQRYQERVFSAALYLLRDQALAEDVTLNVFLAAWDHAADYNPSRGKVSTWLLMMARRRSIDALRRATARGENRRADWADAQQQPGDDNPERAVEARLERERIRKALAELPRDQAEALALAFFQGYTHQEIAAALGQPLGTIKTRIRLAMIKLRSSLADQPTEGQRR